MPTGEGRVQLLLFWPLSAGSAGAAKAPQGARWALPEAAFCRRDASSLQEEAGFLRAPFLLLHAELLLRIMK